MLLGLRFYCQGRFNTVNFPLRDSLVRKTLISRKIAPVAAFLLLGSLLTSSVLFSSHAQAQTGEQAQLNQAPVKTTKLDAPISLAETADSSAPNNPSATRESDRTIFKDWVLNCNDGDCIVHQYILDEKKRVISSVSLHQKGPVILITLTVPLMTRIDHGVNLDILRYDGKQIFSKTLPYSYCTQIGCMLTYPLKDELIKAMQSGRKLRLNFAALDGREVNSIHSLFGFTKALQEFKALPQDAKSKAAKP